jgi:hypothetical protein
MKCPSIPGEYRGPLLISLLLMLSTALRSSSNLKCPERAAMRTIVAALQPTILAAFAMGTPASNIRRYSRVAQIMETNIVLTGDHLTVIRSLSLMLRMLLQKSYRTCLGCTRRTAANFNSFAYSTCFPTSRDMRSPLENCSYFPCLSFGVHSSRKTPN